MAGNERTFWNRFWAEENLLNLKAHTSLILTSEEVLEGFSRKRTLEVGAGRAVDSVEMARRGAKSYVVDFSETSFGISLSLARNSRVEVIPCQADVEHLPIRDNYFDLVFSQGLMEHPGLMERLLPEQVRVTAPGGFVLIDVPQLFSIQAMVKWVELQLGKWPFGLEVNFTERRLREVIKSVGLEYVSSYGREVFPIVRLGIKTALSRATHGDTFECLPINRKLMQIIELSRIGPKVLNNIGVIARKPTVQATGTG